MGDAAAADRAVRSSISDFCLLVEGLDRAVHFYRDIVGFRLRRLAPGFADFFTNGVTLALWQADHMQTHLQLPGRSIAHHDHRRGRLLPLNPQPQRHVVGHGRILFPSLTYGLKAHPLHAGSSAVSLTICKITQRLNRLRKK